MITVRTNARSPSHTKHRADGTNEAQTFWACAYLAMQEMRNDMQWSGRWLHRKLLKKLRGLELPRDEWQHVHTRVLIF